VTDEQPLEGIRGQHAIHISIAPHPFAESELHSRKSVLAYLKRYNIDMAAAASTESLESTGPHGAALKGEWLGGKEDYVIGPTVDQEMRRIARRKQF
jgi:hypothetical protein